LIIVSAKPVYEQATPGHFFQPGKNSLRSNSLPGFQKRPGVTCPSYGFGQNDDPDRKQGNRM
jgi:hypothetical protein